MRNGLERVCINIEPIFVDLPYDERLRRVHSLGFTAAEFWVLNRTYDGSKLTDVAKNSDSIGRTLQELGMHLVTICLNSRDGVNGGGLMTPRECDAACRRLEEILPAVRELQCGHITVLTGLRANVGPSEVRASTIIGHLKRLLDIVVGEPVVLMLESLNTRRDHPGYYLDSIDEAAEIVARVAHLQLKLLFDVYHVQIMAGDIMSRLRAYADLLGHVHFAGVPGRNEVYLGELNYRYILDELQAMGYAGYCGLEYFPSEAYEESLLRTREYLLTREKIREGKPYVMEAK